MSYIVSSVGPLAKPFITTWSQHMIKEPEILDPTGVMYIRQSPHSHLGSVLAESVNVYNPELTKMFNQMEVRINAANMPEEIRIGITFKFEPYVGSAHLMVEKEFPKPPMKLWTL